MDGTAEEGAENPTCTQADSSGNGVGQAKRLPVKREILISGNRKSTADSKAPTILSQGPLYGPHSPQTSWNAVLHACDNSSVRKSQSAEATANVQGLLPS